MTSSNRDAPVGRATARVSCSMIGRSVCAGNLATGFHRARALRPVPPSAITVPSASRRLIPRSASPSATTQHVVTQDAVTVLLGHGRALVELASGNGLVGARQRLRAETFPHPAPEAEWVQAAKLNFNVAIIPIAQDDGPSGTQGRSGGEAGRGGWCFADATCLAASHLDRDCGIANVADGSIRLLSGDSYAPES